MAFPFSSSIAYFQSTRKSFACIFAFGTISFLIYFLFTLTPSFTSSSIADSSVQSVSIVQQLAAAPLPPPSHHIKSDVIIYNRIPKTGSTTFMHLAYQLCQPNGFHVLHVNVTKNSHLMTLPNQLQFVRNVSAWTVMQPAIYHGHFAYVDFSRLGSGQQPIYINMLRDPLDRLVSYYYFLRFGDDFRPHLKRSRMHNPQLQAQTFDDCVQLGGVDCDVKKLWLQVPFLCGQSPACWYPPGNRFALEQAKFNVLNRYFLVGVTEELGKFVHLLEQTWPQFFNHSVTLLGQSPHLRRTVHKKPIGEATRQKMSLSNIWQVEQEFYEFVKANFLQNYQFFVKAAGAQKVFYEKVRP